MAAKRSSGRRSKRTTIFFDKDKTVNMSDTMIAGGGKKRRRSSKARRRSSKTSPKVRVSKAKRNATKRRHVAEGLAKQTPGGLKKSDLKKNKRGRWVSKGASERPMNDFMKKSHAALKKKTPPKNIEYNGKTYTLTVNKKGLKYYKPPSGSKSRRRSSSRRSRSPRRAKRTRKMSAGGAPDAGGAAPDTAAASVVPTPAQVL